MLLESKVCVCDPLKRNISLEEITGQKTSWIEENGVYISNFSGAWINMQGPDGQLDRFNKIGLVNPNNMKPFVILSQREYNKQISQTCLIA